MNAVRRFFPDSRLAVLFVLFFVANLAYLHRVPGFLGDEASEGENVYQILTEEKNLVQGERSYIGVFTDYARMPFVGVLGYSSLAVRLPVFFGNLIFFVVLAFLTGGVGYVAHSFIAFGLSYGNFEVIFCAGIPLFLADIYHLPASWLGNYAIAALCRTSYICAAKQGEISLAACRACGGSGVADASALSSHACSNSSCSFCSVSAEHSSRLAGSYRLLGGIWNAGRYFINNER